MTKVDEAIAYLTARGYRSYRSPLNDNWAGSKRLPEGSPQCEINEHKIAWHAEIFTFREYGGILMYVAPSVELEIIGKRGDQWFKLMVYGLSLDDMQAEVPKAEERLLAAWGALL